MSEYILRKIISRLIKEAFTSNLSNPPSAFSKLAKYSKNKEINVFDDLYDPENKDLRDEFFKPIDDSYRKALGEPNADIQRAEDLMNPARNDYSEFLAWDIDDDPHPDVIRGMKPKSGYMKLSLSATDGSTPAKDYAKLDTVARLMDGQHWAEMSGPAAGVAMKNEVPAITDKEAAMALVAKKNVQWYGEHPYFSGNPEFSGLQREAEYSKAKAETPGQYDGWYVRMLGNPAVPHAKMVFGKVLTGGK